MGENTKLQILPHDLIRRLLNTSERLDRAGSIWEYREEVQKFQNSGFSREQTLRIIVNNC